MLKQRLKQHLDKQKRHYKQHKQKQDGQMLSARLTELLVLFLSWLEAMSAILIL